MLFRSFFEGASHHSWSFVLCEAGPIAKEIGDEFEIEPKRVASILNIFASVRQGLIPYGAQLLSAATLVKLTPFDIIPNLYYPILMCISAVLFMAFRKHNKNA